LIFILMGLLIAGVLFWGYKNRDKFLGRN